jgi:glycosyltransferase involved in cell wall biosynthesis
MVLKPADKGKPNAGTTSYGVAGRPRVLFVAGLDPMKSGGAGGQVAAATTLLWSGLAERVEFIPLSSTMDKVPAPPLLFRIWPAIKRLVRFLMALRRIDVALIFASDGLSMVEKGLMCQLARAAGRGAVIRFSSGGLPAQCERSRPLRWWLRRTLRSAHAVVAQGPVWVAYFSQYSEASGKVVEIRNGVLMRPPHLSKRRGASRIVFAGWMHREKGIFDALEAVEVLRQEFPELTLSCAGGGKDEEEFWAAVRSKGMEHAVIRVGWLEKSAVRDLIASADVFLLPSHYEGLPNAMLEAMAEGTPVVVTRVGSIPDVVDNGVTGLLVDVGDGVAIVGALRRLLSQPALARGIGEAARREIERTYNIDLVWRKYFAAINLACQAAGRAQQPSK